MRLYHSVFLPIILLSLVLLASCTPPRVTQGVVTVSITADGSTVQVDVPAGSTAQTAIEAANLTLGELDRSDPPPYTIMSEGSQVRLIRIREEFSIEQLVIPFERQELLNEALPEGEERMSQPGVNGMEEITYRRVYEDGIEVSNSIVKRVVMQEAIPEIIMRGIQTPYASLPIPGRIAYLAAGNAWIMEGSTGIRRLLVSGGDLDGLIFSLSPDGEWLLFSRSSDEDGTMNTLWAARVDSEPPLVVNLGVTNIVHFADWAPGSTVVAYSTVDPQPEPINWRANNDLWEVGLSSNGFVSPPREDLAPNYSGELGWWGMDFAYGPDRTTLAYAHQSAVGIFDTRLEELTPLLRLIPYQSSSSWAWVPGVAWGPDGSVIYTVDHAARQGDTSANESPIFNLVAIPLEGGGPIALVQDVGMFAYPVPSPVQTSAVTPTLEGASLRAENSYQVAYLQANTPSQSDTSQYRLVVMDRDGSNRHVLFPEEGKPGLEPQEVIWSPEPVGSNGSYVIALVYEDNIWLVNLADGTAQQITGDGLAIRIDWR